MKYCKNLILILSYLSCFAAYSQEEEMTIVDGVAVPHDLVFDVGSRYILDVFWNGADPSIELSSLGPTAREVGNGGHLLRASFMIESSGIWDVSFYSYDCRLIAESAGGEVLVVDRVGIISCHSTGRSYWNGKYIQKFRGTSAFSENQVHFFFKKNVD